MKIIVGNKVDKVCRTLSFHHPLPVPICDCTELTLLPKEFSRQVPTSEGQQYATRMNSLFIEASAKTAVGVREAFREVVEKILDTPELWAPITPAKGKSGTGEGTMPGNIDLSKTHDNQGGVCSC